MKKRYGILSMLCLLFAVFLALFQIYTQHSGWALVYLLLSAASGLMIVLAFCTKCPVKSDCAHVLPGRTARLFKDRNPGPYTRSELLITFIGMGMIILFPQIWLIHNLIHLFLFWLLTIIGLILIVRKICHSCGNIDCPFHSS